MSRKVRKSFKTFKTFKTSKKKRRPNPGQSPWKWVPDGATKELVRELYLSGMSADEIGKRVGVGHDPIFRVLREMGVPIRGRPEKYLSLSEEDKTEIADLYRSGMTVEEIADLRWISKAAVVTVLTNYEVPRKNKVMSEEMLARMASMHRAGIPVKHIAEELGVSKGTIFRRLRGR